MALPVPLAVGVATVLEPATPAPDPGFGGITAVDVKEAGLATLIAEFPLEGFSAAFCFPAL